MGEARSQGPIPGHAGPQLRSSLTWFNRLFQAPGRSGDHDPRNCAIHVHAVHIMKAMKIIFSLPRTGARFGLAGLAPLRAPARCFRLAGQLVGFAPWRVSERMCKEVSVSLPLRGDSHDDHIDDYA